ncbi:putative TIM-barrel fold metal-dependent hydrolase [Paraburkholderia phenoliruptrix]|uniref:amidohydrolase family protein n=1 Tax=Paraburkholderia phenoliruptrix TaxID=252970 RepID=UPI00285C5FFF|nr:amidohydrolase family protein [Paraburkholderia phenoliruptrix]MDR6423117.1 putative TIM-barrel fold metal-dependent hydrolase [Paraburkholderia phenoliruptrix]
MGSILTELSVSQTLSCPGVQQIIEAHLEFPNVRLIRECLNCHRDPVKTSIDTPHLMSDAQWRAGYALLKRYDLSFDLQLHYTQMEEAAALAHAFPDTPVVLNYTGMPVDRQTEEIEVWKKSMTLLASAANVFCKISGLGMGHWKWTVTSIRPFVLHAIEAFSAERCMFARNFPVDKRFSSYDDVFNAFKVITGTFRYKSEEHCFMTMQSASTAFDHLHALARREKMRDSPSSISEVTGSGRLDVNL